MVQLKDSVRYLSGSTDILLIAPHGKPPNSDANTALLTEILAKKLECAALINNKFPRAKRNYNVRNDAEKDGKPTIHLFIQRIFKTGPGKTSDKVIRVVYTLEDSRPIQFHNGLPGFIAVFVRKNDFCRSPGFGPDLGIFINISVCMSSDNNGFFPGFNHGLDIFNEDRLSKYGASQHGPDSAIGTFPLLFQTVFFHPVLIGCDGSIFNTHLVFFYRIGSINGYFVVGFIPVLNPQVVILGI